MIDKPGKYNLTHDEYHADPCPVPSLSTGTMKDMLFKSPNHAYYNHPRLNPSVKPEDDPKFDIGSAAHPLLLEGKNVVEVVDAKNWQTKDAKEKREKAREAGRIPLLPDQYSRVLAMVGNAVVALDNSELDIEDLRCEGESEVSYIWNEGPTWKRSRPDWIKYDRSIIIDYKTTVSANPAFLSKRVIDLGYDIQAAHYIDGVMAVEGIEPKFFFLFQEVAEPYACSVVALEPQFLELGRAKVRQATDLWAYCSETGIWPSYPEKVCYLEMPSWAGNWIFNAPFIPDEEV